MNGTLIQQATGRNKVALSEPAEGVISKQVGSTKKDKIHIGAVNGATFIGAPVLFTLILPEHFLNANNIISYVTTMGIASGGMGILLSNFSLWDITRRKLADAIKKNATGPDIYQAGQAMSKVKKGRVLVNSFHIRESSDIEVNSWQDISTAVKPEEATHIVSQYMVKNKGKYLLEQEVVANDETIWDISADALVEVYEVQEKTNLQELIK